MKEIFIIGETESLGQGVETCLFFWFQPRLSDLLHEKEGTEGPS